MKSKNKKNTVWIVFTCIFALTTVVLAMALYRSHSTLEAVRVQLAEGQTNTITAETNQSRQQLAGAHNMQAVRVMNGILQQQDENEQWVDVAPVADLQQADPVLAGTQNREAVQNGTAGAEQISPLMAKQGILAGATLASASQVQSAVNKTAAQTAKPQTTGNNPLAVTTPAATPAPTQQPVSNDNSSNDDDDDDSSDSGSSDSGSSGDSDSGSSDSGSSGDDSSDSGDGEDIGWTDEVL